MLCSSHNGSQLMNWFIADYNAIAHITEEIKDPELKAPWAISMAMLFIYVVGWLFTIVLCFVLGDITGQNSILDSPIEQPVSQIFFNILGKSRGIIFTVCAFIIISLNAVYSPPCNRLLEPYSPSLAISSFRLVTSGLESSREPVAHSCCLDLSVLLRRH